LPTVTARKTVKPEIISDTKPSTESLRRDIDPSNKCIGIPERGPGDKEEIGRKGGIPSNSDHVDPYTRPELDQDDECESDELDLSETESVLSTTSSATRLDVDALEIISNRLLHYQEFQFLWH